MVAMDGFLSRVDLTPFGSGSGPSDVDQCVGRLTVKNVRNRPSREEAIHSPQPLTLSVNGGVTCPTLSVYCWWLRL